MTHLIFTIDYEIFGDGSGNVENLIINPTNQLLDIFDKYDAKLTLMFEVCEYWAFKTLEESRATGLDYDPSQLMADQAKEAIARGHDVQLHLHPQWIGAKYRNGTWLLNSSWSKLSDLPGGLGDRHDICSITGALYKGKTDLDALLGHSNHNYRCLGFRAGGWCIQPSECIINAMRNVGIISDTSVFAGGFYGKNGEIFDFRKAPRGMPTWWTSTNDVCEIGTYSSGGVLEIPIFTEMGDIFDAISISRLRSFIKYIYNDISIMKNGPNKTLVIRDNKRPSAIHEYGMTIYDSLIRGKKIPFKYDFTKLPAHKMIKMLKGLQYISNNDTPIVLIGHTKDPFSIKAINEFLEYAFRIKKSGNLDFSTYQEAICKQISDENFEEIRPASYYSQ